MVARVWRGRVRAADLPAYRAYVMGTGLRDYKATAGNCGAYIFTQTLGDEGHVMTLSFWDSYQAISLFAGQDIAAARYYPEDERFLLDFPERVEHWEVG